MFGSDVVKKYTPLDKSEVDSDPEIEEKEPFETILPATSAMKYFMEVLAD